MERLKPGDAEGSLKGSRGLVVFKDNLLMRLLLGQIWACVSSGELQVGRRGPSGLPVLTQGPSAVPFLKLEVPATDSGACFKFRGGPSSSNWQIWCAVSVDTEAQEGSGSLAGLAGDNMSARSLLISCGLRQMKTGVEVGGTALSGKTHMPHCLPQPYWPFAGKLVQDVPQKCRWWGWPFRLQEPPLYLSRNLGKWTWCWAWAPWQGLLLWARGVTAWPVCSGRTTTDKITVEMKVGREGMLTLWASNKAHDTRCFIWINSESGLSQGLVIMMHCTVTRSSVIEPDHRVQIPPLIVGKLVNLCFHVYKEVWE